MGIKTYNPYTPSRRHMTGSDFSEITKKTPEKSLTYSLKKNSGRTNWDILKWKAVSNMNFSVWTVHDCCANL